MMRAPCAMFTMFITPQMSDMPRAMRPYRPPSRMPLMRTWRASMAALLAQAPLRRWVKRLGDHLAAHVHGHELALLDLDEHLPQSDLPRRLELDAPVECLGVHGGEGVANLLGIERARLLHGELVDKHVGGSGSDVVVGLVTEALVELVREIPGRLEDLAAHVHV